jgi:hypothetical protein
MISATVRAFGRYHEQTRAIQSVALLSIGCESMAYQGIDPYWISVAKALYCQSKE